MGLAPFFGKAALGLTQMLRGSDYEALRSKLESSPVGLRVGEGAAATVAGRATAELAANLLARLYPKISLTCPDDLREDLSALIRRINPNIEEVSGATATDLLVGSVAEHAESCVGVSACRWQVYLRDGRDPPDVWDDDPNILGGAFAACLGVGAVFRRVFSDLGVDASVHDRVLSLMGYGPLTDDNPKWIEPLLPSPYLVGVGAIGNASIWALQRLPVTGELVLVDDEQIALSNLQRYALTENRHIGWPKVDVAKSGFASPRVHVVTHPSRLERLISGGTSRPQIEHLLLAVDSARDRIAAQTALPRSIWNAWTGDDAVGVSAHRHFGEEPCVACMYIDRNPPESDLAQLTRTLGLGSQDVINLLTMNSGLTAEHIAQIEKHHHLDAGSLGEWIGSSVMRFREQVVCGGLLTTMAGWSDSSEETLVPLAFQSVLAGIVLVTEYIKDLIGLADQGGPTVFRCPVSKPLPDTLMFRHARGADVRCFCTDPDYVSRWTEKWGE